MGCGVYLGQGWDLTVLPFGFSQVWEGNGVSGREFPCGAALGQLHPKKPSQDVPSCASVCESPKEGQDWGLPCQEHSQDWKSQLLRNSGFVSTASSAPGAGEAQLSLGKGTAQKKEKGKGQVQHHKSHPQPPAFPGSISSAQKRIVSLLF